MAANPSVITDSDLLNQARNLFLQQEPVHDKEQLLTAFDDAASSISTETLERLIQLLQNNIDANDYTGRRDATSPIDSLFEIPAIYKSLGKLIDLAVAHYAGVVQEKGIESFLDEGVLHVINAKNTEDEKARLRLVYTDVILDEYRFNRLIGDTEKPSNFKFWNGIKHYDRYPQEKYLANRSVCDRLDIDLILNNQHYLNVPIKKIITDRGRSLPGVVEIDYGSRRAMQYDPETRQCVLMGDERSDFKDLVQASDRGSSPLNLCTSKISNCHVLLARDSKNRIFMLHIPPAAVNDVGPSFWTLSDQPAYIELAQSRAHPALGLKDDSIDVVVVDRQGHFNEEKLRAVLSRVNVKINSLTVRKAEFVDEEPGVEISAEELKKRTEAVVYGVCYFPESDKLLVVSYCLVAKMIEIEHPFPIRAAELEIDSPVESSVIPPP